eukprot:SAG11_NODE_737_length_7431_cov_7.438762_3_plen_96_part_00
MWYVSSKNGLERQESAQHIHSGPEDAFFFRQGVIRKFKKSIKLGTKKKYLCKFDPRRIQGGGWSLLAGGKIYLGLDPDHGLRAPTAATAPHTLNK